MGGIGAGKVGRDRAVGLVIGDQHLIGAHRDAVEPPGNEEAAACRMVDLGHQRHLGAAAGRKQRRHGGGR